MADSAPRPITHEAVPILPIGELVRFRRGAQLTDAEREQGTVPVVTAGRVANGTHSRSNFLGPVVTVSSHGAYVGHVSYWQGPIWLGNNVLLAELLDEKVEVRYLYFLLKHRESSLRELAQSGGVPYVNGADILRLRVPIPPLEVQREIVQVLDSFTELEAELEAGLEAELEARRLQYAHYRSSLLSGSRERVVPLGELLELKAGKFIAAAEISAERGDTNAYPCFGGNGIRGFVPTWSHEGDRVLIGRQGALSGNVRRANGRFYATEHAVVATPREALDTSWLFHALTSMDLNQYVSKGAQPGLAVSTINAVPIEVPTLQEQIEIGETLDKFDALVNDLSIGLPAELAARRKQYEYYRDKLLTFEEAPA